MPYAELSDARIHYRTYGDGPPVIGIMGFGLDQRFWAAQVPAVAERNRFVTFDNRGTGRTEGAIPSSIDEMAEDVIRLLDHLEVEKATVFGVSMGGAIAQRVVVDHPDRVDSLILGITFARPIEYMRRRQAVAEELMRTVTPEQFMDAAMLWMFTPQFFEIGQENLDRMLASFTGPGAPEPASGEVLISQSEAVHKHDVLEHLPKIGCPTLVFGGRQDIMVPYFASEEIAAAIPGSEFRAFETGHGCMIEEMGEVNAMIRDFLDRHTLPAS
jgi:3-oxoadipate enol-lactonase